MITSWDCRTGRAAEPRRIGDAGIMAAIVLDRHGSLAALRKRDNAVEIQRIASGDRLCTITPGTETISDLEFDPASQRLAVVFPGKEISVWDVSKARRTASMPGNYTAAVFGPGGGLVCPSSQGNSLSIWDPEEGERSTIRPSHGGPPLGVAFSHDGTRLACSHGGPGVDIYDWASRKLVLSFKGRIKPVRCHGLLSGQQDPRDGGGRRAREALEYRLG